MAKLISFKVPDRVYAALAQQGGELEQDVPGWLRTMLIAAGTQPEGIRLKLDLPPAPKQDAPLFEAAGVTVETVEP